MSREEAREVMVQWVLHLSVDLGEVASALAESLRPEEARAVMVMLGDRTDVPTQERLLEAYDVLGPVGERE